MRCQPELRIGGNWAGERAEQWGRGKGLEKGGGYVLYDLGGDDFAGTAPGCETVEDHEGVFLVTGRVEVGFTSSESEKRCQFFVLVLVLE